MLCSPSHLTYSLFVCIYWQHEQYSHSSRISVGGESSREKREQSLPGITDLSISRHVVNVSRFPFLSLSITGTAALELLGFNVVGKRQLKDLLQSCGCYSNMYSKLQQQLSVSIYKTKALRWHSLPAPAL